MANFLRDPSRDYTQLAPAAVVQRQILPVDTRTEKI